MIEHFYTCPYCWEEISMLLDSGMNNEPYIEDCEVCCRPIEVIFNIQDDELIKFNYNAIDGIQ